MEQRSQLLPQAAKTPRKEVCNWLPFEPAWRISKDFKMKGVAGRSRGQAESTSAAPGSLLHKWLNADRTNVKQTEKREAWTSAQDY